jgi:DNA-directed RNA polymerase specialized sigma subunit
MNIEQTIDDNIGLVRKMACNLYYENPVYSRDDLIQVGLLNLRTDLQQYNSKKS